VRLRFDENLSRRLPSRLAELFPESQHVSEIGLLQASDSGIWQFAGANGFAIVSADSDFFEMATSIGPPPKVIWLRRWIHRTRDVEALLRREAIRIAEFGSDPDSGVLVLDAI
jgi:predicted nuclease of predicted toxin-antitoxin system